MTAPEPLTEAEVMSLSCDCQESNMDPDQCAYHSGDLELWVDIPASTTLERVARIKADAFAAGRAAERAEWVAKVEALARDLTPAHNCELRYDGTVDQATAAWVEGRHDAVDALRALVEGGAVRWMTGGGPGSSRSSG